jgi:Xaa-Pro aminopeptidase
LDRQIATASCAELERRWALIRDRLVDRGAQALIVVGASNELDGAVRWLTDASITYRRIVIFHAADRMDVLEHGSAGQTRTFKEDAPGYPGVGEVTMVSTFPSVDYTQVYEAQIVAEKIRARGYRKVALLHPMALPYGFLRSLRESLPEVEFLDETEFVDRAKAIKSAEEITVLERAAAIQDAVFRATVDYVKPGMRDFEVAAFAFYQARLLGGAYGITLAGSAPRGEPAFMRADDLQGRTILAGDAMSLLVENGGPGGYYLELGRPLSFGDPSPELQEVYAVAKAAQDYSISLCVPGARAADIYAAYTAYLGERGFPPETRLYAHGQGYDLIERPLIRQDETMILEAGMCLAVHPGLVYRGAFAFTCDNIMVEAEGPRILHSTPRQIFVV